MVGLSGAGAFAEAIPGPAPEAVATADDALATGRDALARAGCESPRLDAELLLAEVLGVQRAEVLTGSHPPLDPRRRGRFESLIRRRAAREPVAYILGRRHFRAIELMVDRRVLIPRPETELLVEAGLELPPGARVIDVGTGSGAVALALKHERPDLRVTGADTSADALAVAAANARRLGLDVRFVEADLLDGAGGPYDALLANPPYVAAWEWPGLAPEIREHEPSIALAAGQDGLDLIRRLVGQAVGVPFVALEVGAGQAGTVREALVAAGFARVETRRDLAGIERLVVGRTG
jgi:release factor glutamine methyltransferase